MSVARIGISGCGAIGRSHAGRLKALGSDLAFFSRTREKAESFVNDLVAQDANSPEFGRRVDMISDMGRNEIAQAAGQSNRFLDRPVRSMDKESGVGNDLAGAWAVDKEGLYLYPTVPADQRQRELAFRAGVNIVMYALTGNYKADQVHVPALLERLGQ